MTDPKPLSFHVPAPAVRPGGTPDFSDVPFSRAGDVRRPEVRERLIAAGLDQAKKFAWERTAAAVRGVLEEVARASRP